MSKKVPRQQSQEELYQLSKEELVKVIQMLHEEITRLTEIITRDSRTSSKPPSQDIIKKSENKKTTAPTVQSQPKRSPGGQPGHQGKTRKGFGRVDRYEVLKAQQCARCGQVLEATETIRIEKQQVAQLVERPIEIVEYQRHQVRCQCCGEMTSPQWSNQMLPGQDLGIKLQGVLGWLGNYGHLPYEKQQELLWELGRINIGVGTLVATNQRLSASIRPSVLDSREWVNGNHPPLNIDETPWSVKGIKEWLWVFAHPDFCLFRAGDTRSRGEIEDQLGSQYPGVIISDDFNVYNGYPLRAQQKCLAHLRRHCQRLLKTPGQNNQSIGLALTKLVDEAFEQHRRFRETGNIQLYLSWAETFKNEVKLTLARWPEKAGYEAGKLLRNLRLKAKQWWYFLDHPEIPPDHNLAERALRLAVTKRKISGGSRSLERFQETADCLSVIQTCRFQGRSVVDFFASALMASVGLGELPSLIPDFAT